MKKQKEEIKKKAKAKGKKRRSVTFVEKKITILTATFLMKEEIFVCEVGCGRCGEEKEGGREGGTRHVSNLNRTIKILINRSIN